jgi:hypothetical protein
MGVDWDLTNTDQDFITGRGSRNSMNHRKQKQRIELIIELPETVGDEPDGFQRLRKFLKALLRIYRIRCVSVGPCGESGGVRE